MAALVLIGCASRDGARVAPAPADDPAALAIQLAWAERVIRESPSSAAQLERAGRPQQAATLKLVERPEWRQPVLDRIADEEIRLAVSRNIEAGAALRAMIRAPRESLPNWRIVKPAPADELMRYYKEAEQAFGVPWQYLAAIHLVETRMGRIRGTSVAGAQGPMQFMPATWAQYGEGDVNDNRDAILAAGRYLRASGAPQDMRRALFAYNRSDNYVRAVELYARNMRDDPRAYRGYYHWQVYYLTTRGNILLEEGWQGPRAIDMTELRQVLIFNADDASERASGTVDSGNNRAGRGCCTGRGRS